MLVEAVGAEEEVGVVVVEASAMPVEAAAGRAGAVQVPGAVLGRAAPVMVEAGELAPAEVLEREEAVRAPAEVLKRAAPVVVEAGVARVGTGLVGAASGSAATAGPRQHRPAKPVEREPTRRPKDGRCGRWTRPLPSRNRPSAPARPTRAYSEEQPTRSDRPRPRAR